jgi:hypothetical protein
LPDVGRPNNIVALPFNSAVLVNNSSPSFLADARSAKLRKPQSVRIFLHVSLYSREPSQSSRSRNLLAKDDVRAALGDESPKRRPEVARVVFAEALPGDGERLARAGAGPDWLIVGPSGETESEGPAGNSGEEMALGVSNKVVCIQFLDWGFVHVAGRDFASMDKAAEPLRGVGVDFVVKVHRPHSPAAGTRVTLRPRMSTGLTTSMA